MGGRDAGAVPDRAAVPKQSFNADSEHIGGVASLAFTGLHQFADSDEGGRRHRGVRRQTLPRLRPLPRGRVGLIRARTDTTRSCAFRPSDLARLHALAKRVEPAEHAPLDDPLQPRQLEHRPRPANHRLDVTDRAVRRGLELELRSRRIAAPQQLHPAARRTRAGAAGCVAGRRPRAIEPPANTPTAADGPRPRTARARARAARAPRAVLARLPPSGSAGDPSPDR